MSMICDGAALSLRVGLCCNSDQIECAPARWRRHALDGEALGNRALALWGATWILVLRAKSVLGLRGRSDFAMAEGLVSGMGGEVEETTINQLR
jgi:hypothetical protein